MTETATDEHHPIRKQRAVAAGSHEAVKIVRRRMEGTGTTIFIAGGLVWGLHAQVWCRSSGRSTASLRIRCAKMTHVIGVAAQRNRGGLRRWQKTRRAVRE